MTVYDPDAPTGSGFWHWLIANIPASTTSLPKNAGDPKADLAPKGSVQSRTDFGTSGYGGPCPPKGDKPHRYIFTVFAVDTDKLDVTPDTHGRGRRLQLALPHPGKGDIHGPLRTLISVRHWL